VATKTKRKPTTEAPAEQPAAPQKLDDRTPLDDAAERKRKGRPAKKQLPEGYKKRLPAGTVKKVRVVKDELGKEGGKPYRVEEEDGTARDYDRVKIEGESEMKQDEQLIGCGVPGRGWLETTASVLVGRGRKATRK
jgi:hypothetical protein